MRAAETRAKHILLDTLHARFNEFVPGVSICGLLLCTLATTTTLLGPVTVDFISCVRDDGTQSTWQQPAGNFYLFVAGPGQFKSGTMNICSKALDATIDAIQQLKSSLGGTISVHKWIDHIIRDAGGSVFRDGSTSAWFERIKGARPCAL